MERITKCPDVNLLAALIHGNAVQHGFWDYMYSDEHYLCLAACELAELVEANRKGRMADMASFVHCINETPSKHEAATAEQRYAYWFETYIKDTLQDEMADTVIRLLDLAGAKNVVITAFDSDCEYCGVVSTFSSLPENVLRIMGQLAEVGILRYKINKALRSMAELADEWEVDLWWHVEAKMRYNQNRPYKHGKKY